MAFGSGMEIIMMLLMMGGGVQDFLDVVPTAEYWQAKNVEISDKTLLAELAPPAPVGDISKLIDALADEAAANREAAAKAIRDQGPGAIPQLQKAIDSGNPEISARAKRLIQELQNSGAAKQVRLLMAIRTAGERKMQPLLPRLRELQQSKAMFVADYASAAVAAIEGKTSTRFHQNCGEDPWLLPLGTRGILHMQMTGSAKAITSDEIQKMMAAMSPGNPNAGPDAMKQLMQQIIGIVEQTGNIRLDAITVGISGDVGPRSGHVVVLGHGQFDSAALAELIAKASGKPLAMTEGCASLELDKTSLLLFPGNGYVALMGGPHEVPMPTKELIAAFKAGKSGLKEVPEVKQLVAGLDTTATMWGALQINNAMREAPLFKSIDSLTLVGRTLGGQTDFTFQAFAQNGQDIAGAVGIVNQGVADGKNELHRELERQKGRPTAQFLQTMSDVLETVKCAQDPKDPKRATLTATIKAPTISTIFGFMGGMMFSARAEPMPPQQVVPVPPPPPAPVPPQAPRERLNLQDRAPLKKVA